MPTVPLARKPDDYYSTPRDEIIAQLPRPLGSVLDVGCGEGASHPALVAAGATSVVGVEIVEAAAARAAERYDRVLVGDALEQLEEVDGPFDTVLCYDVLEHLVDPASVLRRVREIVDRHGTLHVSVPNARYFSLTVDLVFRGTFGYREAGLQDATHLRWFTRRDIEALLREAGFAVASTTPAYGPRVQRLLRATRGVGTEFLTTQWSLLAHPC